MLFKGIDVLSRGVLGHKAIIINGVDILVALGNLHRQNAIRESKE